MDKRGLDLSLAELLGMGLPILKSYREKRYSLSPSTACFGDGSFLLVYIEPEKNHLDIIFIK